MSRSRSFLIRDLLWGQDRRGEAETRGTGDELGLDLTTRPLGCSRATQCSNAQAVVSTDQSLFSADTAASSLLGTPDARRTTPLLQFTPAGDDFAAPGNRSAAKRSAGLCVCGKEAREGCVCVCGAAAATQGLESSLRWVPQVPRVGAGQHPDSHDQLRRSPGGPAFQGLSDDAGGVGGGGGCDLSWRARVSPTPTPSPSTPPPQSPPVSPSVPRRRTPSPPTSSPMPALLPGFPAPAYGGSRGFLRPEKVLDVRRLLPLPGGRGQYGGVPLVAPQHHHHHYLWAARYSSLLSSLPLQGEHRGTHGAHGGAGQGRANSDRVGI